MKRAEFLERWVRTIQEGRARLYPDITPAENAASAWSDRESGKRLWRKHHLARATDAQLERLFATKQPRGGGPS